MQEDAKAIRVPFHATDRVFPQAFSHVAKVRHVPQTRVFCRCYALREVLAPGCKQFGAQVFEECCSLMQIGIRNDATNQ